MGTAPKVTRAEPPPVVKIGDVVLERYRVVEQIAAGGHSVVFRGQDERLSRPVCIKVFSGLGRHSGVGRTSYEHFVQEAFALSRLTHPNTLRIYDFGHLGANTADGMPLQVCEYMNGGTLAQVVREQGPQSVAETARVVNAMCLALGEAHGLGIVHRDIKPQNILFGEVGGNRLPKLADFGIAKWSADTDDENDQRAEDTAVVAGQKLAMYSPSWAAPEQLAGQPVSPTTDIYSLACVAAYMLSGKAIFADEDVYAGYRKRRNGGPLLRDALEPLGVPAAVIELLGTALAFDPKQRVSSVERLATALATAIAPPSAPPEVQVGPVVFTPQPSPVVPVPQPAPQQPAPTQGFAPVVSRAPTPSQPFPQVAPPASLQPWMAAPSPAKGLARRLPLSDVAQQIGDRRTHYVYAPNHVADLAGPHNSRIRVTFQSAPNGGRAVHLKGLSCFVALLGGRPSPAVHIEHACDIALVTPRAQELGHVRIATGTAQIAEMVFAVGAELVAVSADDCADAILFDFGPGSEAYFVYTRGRAIPKLRRG